MTAPLDVRARAIARNVLGAGAFAHAERVAGSFTGAQERAVAYLHDVLEDSDLTESELRPLVGDDGVVDAVVELTWVDGERYADYVERVRGGSRLAVHVTVAGLRDNLAREPRRGDLARRPERALRSLLEAVGPRCERCGASTEWPVATCWRCS